MKFKLLLVALIFTSGSFFAQNIKTATTVDGNIIGGNYTEISILDIMSGEEIEKTSISDNKFHFDIDLKDENIFALFLDRKNYMIIVLKPGEKTNINYDTKKPENNSVTGSTGTEFYLKTFSALKQLPENKQDIFLDSVVNANPENLVSVIFAMYLDYNTYAETHKKLIKTLDKFDNNKIVQEYKKNYEASQKLAFGSVPPEIALPNTEDKIVKLSSLKGQYVLLDFWAAWCRPCRGESPNLVKAYNKYHDKGFTIYSVSLDNTKTDWLDAIKSDNLQAWTHVSDLNGWKNIAAVTYGVRSIPSNFLLDKDGKIIAKNLRGAELEKKLAEIFDN